MIANPKASVVLAVSIILRLLCFSNASANPPATEFQVNTFVSGNNYNSAIAIDAEGDFVIAWFSDQYGFPNGGIHARMYNRGGTPKGSEFQVNTITDDAQYRPAIAMAGDGSFVVVWKNYSALWELADVYGPDYLSGIYAQRYDFNGTPREDRFLIDRYTFGVDLVAAIGPSGNLIVVWNDIPGNIYARMYGDNGEPVGERLQVCSDGNTGLDMAADSEGSFVVTFRKGNDIHIRMYDNAGNPLGDEFQVNRFGYARERCDPAVAVGADGSFVVTWRDLEEGICARRYSSIGESLDHDKFLVSSSPSDGDHHNPDIAMDHNGDFVIAWWVERQRSLYADICARRYDASGTPVGAEFQVNTFTEDYHYNPAIAMNQIGDLIIAWSTQRQDGNDTDIYTCLRSYEDDQAIIDIAPNSAIQGETTLVEINGIDLTPSCGLSFSSNDIIVNSLNFVSSTRMDANIAILSGAALGPHTVILDCVDSIRTGTFIVNPAGVSPSLAIDNASLKPHSGNNDRIVHGQLTHIMVNGRGFSPESDVGVLSPVEVTMFDKAFLSPGQIYIAIETSPGGGTLTPVETAITNWSSPSWHPPDRVSYFLNAEWPSAGMPTPLGDVNQSGSVRAFDAGIILRSLRHESLEPSFYAKYGFSGSLGDVDRNGNIQPEDASLILKYLVGIYELLASASDDMRMSIPQFATASSYNAASSAAEVAEKRLEISVDNVLASPGDTVSVVIYVSDISASDDIIGAEFTLSFDSHVLDAVNVSKGDIAAEWEIEHGITHDEVKVAMAGDKALEERGRLAAVKFSVLSQMSSENLVEIILRDAFLNEDPVESTKVKINIAPPWDVNRDGVVDILDLLIVGKHLGEKVKNTDQSPNPDINGDMMVDIYDIILVGIHFGESYDDAETSPGKRMAQFGNVNILLRIYSTLAVISDPSADVTNTKELVSSLLKEASGLPVAESKLMQNFPNPFNADTWLPYQLATPSKVSIDIYDAQGYLVRALHFGYRSAGFYVTKADAAYWDGRNETGEGVSSGTYFYSIRAGRFASTRKMLMVK